MSEPEGLDAARLDLRQAGYCVVCDRIVEREPDGSCPAGHPPDALTGRIMLSAEEDVPRLPRFNWAAFALPPVWGPAHGEWVGLVFLPIWLFVDSILSSATTRALPLKIGSALVVAGTLGFQAFFAKRANGQAWRRVCDRESVADFARRQRVWAYVCVPVAVALLAAWIAYRLAHPVG